MRPVDADALKAKAFGKRGDLIHTSDIDAAPTVDAVPVVRCRDCKHRQYDSMIGSFWCGGGTCGGIEIEADFFCKDGE